MKANLQKFIMTLSVMGLVASCSTTSDVASNRGIQKRKYTKGYFFEFNHHKGGNSGQNENIVFSGTEPVEEIPAVITEQTQRDIEKEVVFVEEINYVQPLEANLMEEDQIEAPLRTENPSFSNNSIASPSIEMNEKIETRGVNKVKFSERKAIKKVLISAPSEQSDDAILYYILAILLPWLAVGLVTDWDPFLTIIAVVLWFCFWIPGIIFALVVVHNNV